MFILKTFTAPKETKKAGTNRLHNISACAIYHVMGSKRIIFVVLR